MTLIELAGLRGAARRVGGGTTVRAPHRRPLRGKKGLPPACTAVTWNVADLLARTAWRRLPEVSDGYTPSVVHGTPPELAWVLRGDTDGRATQPLGGRNRGASRGTPDRHPSGPPRASWAELSRARADRVYPVAAVAALETAGRHADAVPTQLAAVARRQPDAGDRRIDRRAGRFPSPGSRRRPADTTTSQSRSVSTHP